VTTSSHVQRFWAAGRPSQRDGWMWGGAKVTWSGVSSAMTPASRSPSMHGLSVQRDVDACEQWDPFSHGEGGDFAAPFGFELVVAAPVAAVVE
jgi:hypothetical protein